MKKTLHFCLSIIFLLIGITSNAREIDEKNLVCPTATISYSSTVFCTSSNPQNVILTGTDAYLGGVFSAMPLGLNINPTTGAFIPTASTPGTYTITYTIAAGSGCPSYETTTTITISDQPNAGTDGSTTVCETSTTPINLFDIITGEQPGGTWVSVAGTGGTFNAVTGTYTPALGATPVLIFTYTLVGAAPCINDTSVATIYINQQPNAGLDGSITVCDGSTTPIDLFSLISGEQPGGTWVRNMGTGGTFNAAAGTFTPAIGCTTSSFVYTLVGTAPCVNDSSLATVTISPGSTNATISGSTTICAGTTASLTITGTPGAVITFTNQSTLTTVVLTASGLATISVAPTVTTTYSLVSGQLNGCTTPIVGQSATVNVSQTPQFVNQIPDMTVCNGSTLNIASQLTSTVSGTTYFWSATTNNLNSFFTSGDETNINQVATLLNSSQNGSMSLTVVPKIGNCFGVSQEILITVNAIPVITSVVATDNSICNNETVQINTSANTSVSAFNWQVNNSVGVQIVGGSTSGTSTTGNISLQLALINATTSGTISFNITPINGNCTGTPYTTSFISVNPIPGTPIALTSQTICSEELSNFVIMEYPNIAGTVLEWTVIESNNVTGVTSGSSPSPATIEDFLVNNSNVQGHVKYRVQSKLGDCYSNYTDYIVYVNPLPNLFALVDGEITLDSDGNIVTPYILDTGIPSQWNYSFEWYLNSTVIPGATSSSFTAVEEGEYGVLATNLTTGCTTLGTAIVTENIQAGGLISYSDPLFDTLNFRNSNKVKTIQISNQLGQVVLTSDINSKNGSIDLSELNLGIYNITFDTENGTVNQRFIKN